MRIASITTSTMPTSTAHSIQAAKVTQALAQVNDGPVHLWVPGKGRTSWERMASNYGLSTSFGIGWLPANRPWRRYDFTLEALEAARKWKADMIYTWTIQVAALATLRGIPTILEMHDVPTGRLGPWLFLRYIRSHAPYRMLCTTRALRAKLEETLGFSLMEQKVRIAPNGTDMARYAGLPCAADARRQLGLQDNPTVVYTGHFYSGRGMDLLLDLAHAFPSVSFLWVGGKPRDVDPWRDRLKEAGLGNVTITGFIENDRLPLYQAAADVLVMPYNQAVSGSGGGNIVEVFNPMKMFDYLATGRAILSSDLPVLHEVLNAGNAEFARPGDSQEWIEALGGLLADPLRREKLGGQARQDAAQYDWQVRAKTALAQFPS